MKIALYSHSIAPSIDGVCRRFTGIIHELARQGHDLLLFTLEEHPEDLPANIRIVRLDYMFFLEYPKKKVAKPNLRTILRIFSAINEYRPDVIHVTADGLSQFFTLPGLIFGIPVVGSFHTDLLDLLSSHNALAFQKWCIQFKEKVDSVVLDSCATTSVSFQKKLATQGLKCEHIIITAVDTDIFNKNKKSIELRDELTFGDKNAFLCTYVGRISKEKRIDIIATAIKDIEGAYLAIIGDGPSAHVYSSRHGKSNRLYCQPKFLSHEELASIYACSDVHVTASQFETLGNTVLEAFACGIPVVAPNTQGFCDTVRNGIDGFLFQPADAEDAKRYILKLKNDINLRATMGEAGRLAVSNRSIAKVVEDLVVWYSVGLARRRARSWLKKAFILSMLLVSAPFTMFCMGGYDLVTVVIGWYKRWAMKPRSTTTSSHSNTSKSA